MDVWFLICAVLLLVSGGAKLTNPVPTSGALTAASLPSGTAWVRGLGGVEIMVGTIAVAFGGPVGGIAVAAVYLGFAGFVGYVLTTGRPLASCGCFGRSVTPPSWLHVVVNLAAAASGVWAATAGYTGLPDSMPDSPGFGLPLLALVGAGVIVLYRLFTSGVRTRRTPETPLYSTGRTHLPSTTLTGKATDGSSVTIPVEGDGYLVLVFLSTACMSCRTLWTEPVPVFDAAAVVAVTKSVADENPETIDAVNVHHLPVVMSTSVWQSLGIPVAPFAVVIDRHSSSFVSEGVVASWTEVADLVENTADRDTPPPPDTPTLEPM